MVLTRALTLIVALVLISPIFGVIGAEAVGYTEPLEVTAEMIGLKEKVLWPGLFPDYTVSGLPDVLGYVVSGLVGVAILLMPVLLRDRLGADKGSG